MSLSHHLVNEYDRKPIIPPQGPSRPTYPMNPSLATPFGNRTMDPDATWMSGHGGFPTSPSVNGFSKWSEEKIAALQVRLARKLGPEYVTQRPGPGGGPKLSYIEGWKVINLANEVFGFNGWSSSIVSLTTDFHDISKEGRSSCNVTAIIRITLADGSWHEDVGCGQSENIKGKGAALDKAKKEAVTDGTKRALRTFGNVLGNCLYDKDYTKEVVKIKVPPAKFQQTDLERRPEFTPAGAPGPSKVAAPPAPNQMLPPERPDTPIKSILEAEEGDVFMENFDGEFIDDSILQDLEVSKAPEVPPEPIYQHRQRPGPPAPAKTYQPSGAAARQAAMLAALSESENQAGVAERQISSSEKQAGLSERQAGSSGETVAEAPLKIGGFNLASRVPARGVMGPPRTSSPTIPSGGIDAVAARAQASYSARAAALGLQEDVRESSVTFSSARGMKRAISNEERSPTKQPDRGFRQPLGDIVNDQEWKRQRG